MEAGAIVTASTHAVEPLMGNHANSLSTTRGKPMPHARERITTSHGATLREEDGEVAIAVCVRCKVLCFKHRGAPDQQRCRILARTSRALPQRPGNLHRCRILARPSRAIPTRQGNLHAPARGLRLVVGLRKEVHASSPSATGARNTTTAPPGIMVSLGAIRSMEAGAIATASTHAVELLMGNHANFLSTTRGKPMPPARERITTSHGATLREEDGEVAIAVCMRSVLGEHGMEPCSMLVPFVARSPNKHDEFGVHGSLRNSVLTHVERASRTLIAHSDTWLHSSLEG